MYFREHHFTSRTAAYWRMPRRGGKRAQKHVIETPACEEIVWRTPAPETPSLAERGGPYSQSCRYLDGHGGVAFTLNKIYPARKGDVSPGKPAGDTLGTYMYQRMSFI